MIKQGLIWDFLGKLFNQGITIIISIFLARLLLPEDFAVIAIILAIIGISSVFVDFSLSAALIQQKEVENIHVNSIFWINVSVASLLAIVFFFAAPLIADFYNQEELTLLIQVTSFSFIINAFGGVHLAMLKKEMKFKTLSKITVLSSFISGVIAVFFALTGYGVWSLVIQFYCAAILKQILLWNSTKWLPQFEFSWTKVKPMWNFSKKLFLSSLINTIYVQVDVFIIGKLFAPATLGFYSRGKNLNQLVSNYSSSSLMNVLFPALSKIQDNLVDVKKKVSDFFKIASLISFFLGGLLYVIAEDIIVILFTEKWLETIPYFRIMVLSTFAQPLSAIILTPLTSLGRSDIFLKLEIIKNSLLTFTYIIGFSFGITGFLYALFIHQLIGVSLNCYYAGKIINWKLTEQLKIILKYAVISLIGAGPLFFILSNDLIDNYVIHLVLSSILFTSYYIFVNYIFKTSGFQILNGIVSPKIRQLIKR